jgi:hypothetical protein
VSVSVSVSVSVRAHQNIFFSTPYSYNLVKERVLDLGLMLSIFGLSEPHVCFGLFIYIGFVYFFALAFLKF